jgi:hypothetical protein
MGYVYRPDHPMCNENGMIDRSLDYRLDVGVAPNVISDIMPETRHMASGRFHTSKSEFRKDTKAHGCIEYGNDPALTRPRKPIPLSREKRREDIQRAFYDARNGRRSDG